MTDRSPHFRCFYYHYQWETNISYLLGSVSTFRVYKKVSTNGKLVLYLLNRDLIITKDTITPLHAVITVDADEVRNKKVKINKPQS